MAKTYRRITSKDDLKVLHEEAKAIGKLEVGLSRGNNLYAWDESRDNLRVISIDEAAERLGLTTKQVDQIITSGGEVVFEEPKPEPIPEFIPQNQPIQEPDPEIKEIITPMVEEAAVAVPAILVEDPSEEQTEDDLPFDEPEEPITEADMWKRIESMINELVNDKLAETKEQLKDAVKSVLDDTIEALTRIRESLD